MNIPKPAPLRGPSPSSTSGVAGISGVTGYVGNAGSIGTGPGVESDTYKFYQEVLLTRKFIVLKSYQSEIVSTNGREREAGEVNLPEGTKITGSKLAALFAKDTCNMPENFRFDTDNIMAINEENNVVIIRIHVTDHNFAEGFLLKETLFTDGNVSWDDRRAMVNAFLYILGMLTPEQAVQVIAMSTARADKDQGITNPTVIKDLMKAVLSGYFKEEL
jgi:hypothetical protein